MPFQFFGEHQHNKEACLKDFKPANPPPWDKLVVFHAVVVGTFTPLHRVSLFSLKQVLGEPCEIHVWARPQDYWSLGRSLPSWAKRRLFVPEEMFEGTLMAQVGPELIQSLDPVAVADAARWAILYKFGGTYFDLDMFFLKDPRPLTGIECCYQWSDQRCGNSAFLNLYPRSLLGLEMLSQIGRTGSAHPRKILDFDKTTLTGVMHVLPVFLFDPLWVERDREHSNLFDHFFEKQPLGTPPAALDTFCKGAYAYHWHGRWDRIIEKDAQIGQLYEEVKRKLLNRPLVPEKRRSSDE